MKIGKNWLKIASVYKKFANDYPNADFSDSAALAMYKHETYGEPMPYSDLMNGFELGKKWMDVTISAWKDDISQGMLLVSELLEGGYPDWFLERVGVLHLRPKASQCEWMLAHDYNGF